jgi:predicted phage terminase large subunit-like protein
MPSEDVIRAAAIELLRRRSVRRDFGTWCEEALAPLGHKPAEHHRLIISELQKVADGKNDRLMMFLPPGSAKALALHTPIPTPSGWTTMGDLKIGDWVFDENGQQCQITWKSQVWKNRPVYKVITDCGDEIIADCDHEWRVRLCRKPRAPVKYKGYGRPPAVNRDDPDSHFKIKETWELHKNRTKRPLIERAKALELPDAELPIDPYLLGVWLGDGTGTSVRITSSVEDQPWLRAELERLGYETRNSSVPTLFGVSGVRGRFVEFGLLNDPHHNTFGRKHIPDVYMRASKIQRLSLLQGLVDTDGTVCKKRGCTTFCNTNLELILSVRELVRSLGVKAGWSEGRAMLNGKDCGPVYRVSFYLADSARMPRKRILCKNQTRTPNTYIDVEPCGFEDTVCIEVNSKSHLFLCGRSMTPTHNSTFTSLLFPPWFFAREANLSIIGASHTASLAENFSRRVQALIRDNKATLGYGLASESAELWTTSNGGQYRAAGVGGAITGFRGSIAICDDLVKSRADAESETYRQRSWDWFSADLRTRMKPGAPIVVIGTRWHPSDIYGRLLEADPGAWRVLKIPAIAEDEDDPLGRAAGQVLWGDDAYGYGASLMRAKEEYETAGAHRDWAALFQQRPTNAGGGIFKVAQIGALEAPPAGLRPVRAWDLASTAATGTRDPDWTVGILLAKNSFGNYIVLDMVRLRGGPEETESAIMATAARDGKNVPILLPQDPGQAGKSQVAYFTRRLAGYTVKSSPESGDKATRAMPVASQVNVGNLSIVHGAWNRAFIDELAAFPGAKDDVIDALSRAFSEVGDTSAADRFRAMAS